MSKQTLHLATFEYLKPTSDQSVTMDMIRRAAAEYADILDALLPGGPGKLDVLNRVREAAMWANVHVTREEDGTPRLPG